MSGDRLRRLTLLVSAVALIAFLAGFVVVGLRIPDRWTTVVWAGGFIHGTITQPPFPAFSTVNVFTGSDTPIHDTHFYLLGSDAGGRDLFALTSRAVIPSLELVILALVARMALGVAAGFLIASNTEPLRTVARAAGGWVAGFPYLALAVLVIQSFTGGPSTVALPSRTRLIAFVVAIAVVGWRDIAELVASRMEWVNTQYFADAAHAVGSTGFGFFRRHAWPFIRQGLTIELSFQASAVLVLLAELGFLQYYLGGFTQLVEEGPRLSPSASFQLATQPELGQMMSDVRLYLLRNELLPALVPALALASLSFELLGRALRGKTDFRT